MLSTCSGCIFFNPLPQVDQSHNEEREVLTKEDTLPSVYSLLQKKSQF